MKLPRTLCSTSETTPSRKLGAFERAPGDRPKSEPTKSMWPSHSLAGRHTAAGHRPPLPGSTSLTERGTECRKPLAAPPAFCQQTSFATLLQLTREWVAAVRAAPSVDKARRCQERYDALRLAWQAVLQRPCAATVFGCEDESDQNAPVWMGPARHRVQLQPTGEGTSFELSEGQFLDEYALLRGATYSYDFDPQHEPENDFHKPDPGLYLITVGIHRERNNKGQETTFCCSPDDSDSPEGELARPWLLRDDLPVHIQLGGVHIQHGRQHSDTHVDIVERTWSLNVS